MDRLVAHGSLVAHLDADRIEKHHRIQRLQRTRLPLGDLRSHCVGDRADQLRRNLRAIDLLQVPLDLTGAHAARVERDHLVVETRQPALVFADQHRIKARLAVARNGDLDLAVVGQHALAAGAVAVVLAFPGCPILGQVVLELGRHQPVQKGLLQLAQQAVLAHHRRWLTAGQQLVNQFVPYGHGSLQARHRADYDPSHKIPDRLPGSTCRSAERGFIGA